MQPKHYDEIQGSHGFYRQINHFPQFDICYLTFYLHKIKNAALAYLNLELYCNRFIHMKI